MFDFHTETTGATIPATGFEEFDQAFHMLRVRLGEQMRISDFGVVIVVILTKIGIRNADVAIRKIDNRPSLPVGSFACFLPNRR